MSADRELLKMAAKAAGIENLVWWEAMNTFQLKTGVHPCPMWNPLTDDGDALRLAVKLDLLTGPAFWHERSVQYAADAFNGDRQDPYAATRRAIVRAAAEIGKEGSATPLGDGEGAR